MLLYFRMEYKKRPSHTLTARPSHLALGLAQGGGAAFGEMGGDFFIGALDLHSMGCLEPCAYRQPDTTQPGQTGPGTLHFHYRLFMKRPAGTARDATLPRTCAVQACPGQACKHDRRGAAVLSRLAWDDTVVGFDGGMARAGSPGRDSAWRRGGARSPFISPGNAYVAVPAY